MKSYAFLPGSQVLYTAAEFEDGADSVAVDKFLASYDKVDYPISLSANITKETKDYVANAMIGKSKAGYRINDVAPEIMQAQKAKLKINLLKRKTMGGGYHAEYNADLQKAYEEYRAAVNSDNTNQVTIVQFVNALVGKLEQASYITTAFTHIGLDKLRGKVPEAGWPSVNIQVDRLSEPEISHTEFGQTEFRIKRNDIHIYMSREDRMEATIDPFAVSVQQGNIQMQRARELLALKELSNLQTNGTYGTIPDMQASTSTSAPRSDNDAPYDFVNVLVSHFNTYFNYLKYFIFNPLDYRIYLSNWFTHAYTQIQVPEGFGVIPFFGLEKYGAVAIVSPYVPRGFCYSLTDEGAFELDGPKIIDSEYDAKKFADYNIVHDFIGYKVMNPKRFGEKLVLAGITPGYEIETDKDIYDRLKAPKDLVVKNAKA